MAGETFLLAGNQLATYAGFSDSYPPPQYNATITYTGVSTLGNANDRFFLVRSQGNGETVSNGHLFEVFNAVDDGNGNLVPGPSPIYDTAQAQPSSFDGATAGDNYIALGMWYGDNIILNLDGFDSGSTFVAIEGSDGDHDGELQLSEIAAANPNNVPCFTAGCPIETDNGPVMVEDLQPGMLIKTMRNGLRRLKYVSQTTVEFCGENQHLRPVRINKGAMGRNLPTQSVTLSPQHRLVIGNWKSELLIGHRHVFCAAKHLVDGHKIEYDMQADSVDDLHLHFSTHEIVQSAGIWSESYDPAARLTRGRRTAQQNEFSEIFDKHDPLPHTDQKTALPVVKSYEAKVIRFG